AWGPLRGSPRAPARAAAGRPPGVSPRAPRPAARPVGDRFPPSGRAGPPRPRPPPRQQHGEHILLVLAPERPRIPGQQPPVAALQRRWVTHAVPRAGLSRDSAAAALACNRSASAASSRAPLGVSR